MHLPHQHNLLHRISRCIGFATYVVCWVTFSIDGRYAYPSTGEVIEVATRKTVATLADEKGAPVHSEKMLEVDVDSKGNAVGAGSQFGLGAVRQK